MNSRSERVLLAALLLVSAVMAIVLIRLRERTQDRLQTAADAAPLTAPTPALRQEVTLMIANDTDGSLVNAQRSLALPTEQHARARFLLNELLAEYAKPNVAHPIATNAGVDDVFLMPVPQGTQGGGLLAVINLSGALARVHPSGIEPETMTLLSLIGTLHANLPEVTQVRFLVDGSARDTLAGHADLSRTYLAASAAPAATEPAQ